MKIKELLNGTVVGTGSDYLVIQKENQKKRYLVEIYPDNIKELKNSSTPYGSQIDWQQQQQRRWGQLQQQQW